MVSVAVSIGAGIGATIYFDLTYQLVHAGGFCVRCTLRKCHAIVKAALHDFSPVFSFIFLFLRQPLNLLYSFLDAVAKEGRRRALLPAVFVVMFSLLAHATCCDSALNMPASELHCICT